MCVQKLLVHCTSTQLTFLLRRRSQRRRHRSHTQHAVQTLNHTQRHMILTQVCDFLTNLVHTRKTSRLVLCSLSLCAHSFVFLFAADCVAASSTSSLSLCPPLPPPLSLSVVTDEACPSQRGKPGRFLDTNVPITGKCKRSCWLYLSHTAQHFKYRHQLASPNSSCQQLSIYLFLMPSVYFNVTLRPPELWRQSAGSHWLYRLHSLQILRPPSDRSGVSPSHCFLFFCCCCFFLNWALLIKVLALIPVF